jgi:hypothetical protein
MSPPAGNNQNDDQLMEQVQALFRKASAEPLDEPEFLKTRVLAELRGRRRGAGKARFWQTCAMATSLLSVLFMLRLVTASRDQVYTASVGQPFAVRVEMEELRGKGVDSATIELPSGVRFYSEQYPEIGQMNHLEVAVDDSNNRTHLPFVIQGDGRGVKQITLRFFDKDKHQVAVRKLSIRFRSLEG